MAEARRPLNLATNPAGGYRAFFAAACLAAGVLLVTAGYLAFQYAGAGGPAGGLEEQERRLLEEQRAVAKRGADATAKVEAPGTVATLDRTAFLNELLVRKGVSWTRTFLDLEQVLPPEVRVLSIRPEVAYDDRISLEMTVSAKLPANFIGFLKALEGSELFGSPALRGSAPPDDGDPTYRYQLAVEYGQQL